MKDAVSTMRLVTVAPALRAVIEKAALTCPQPFIVVEGARSREKMWENFGKGRTPAECAAKGVPLDYARPAWRKVTWLRDPLMSNHRVMEDGFGHAVDLGALVDGKYDGNNSSLYDVIAASVFAAASALSTHIRWGGDWDGDSHWHEHGETDLAHFELVG